MTVSKMILNIIQTYWLFSVKQDIYYKYILTRKQQTQFVALHLKLILNKQYADDLFQPH